MSATPIEVIDLETTQKAKHYPFAATPHHPDNHPVLYGFRNGKGETRIFDHDYAKGWSFSRQQETSMFVGQNLKFDLTHLCKTLRVAPREYLQAIVLWDVGVAHYLQKGMRVISPSLDTIAECYGFAKKPTLIGDMFEKGKGADDIIADGFEKELKEYLKHDLLVTDKIFQSQAKELSEAGLLKVMQAQMMALKAYIEMEYNGIAIDKTALTKIEGSNKVLLDVTNHTLELAADRADWPTDKAGKFSASRIAHLELLFFGGEVKYEEKVPVGTYKNGKPKLKLTEKKMRYPGLGLDPSKYTTLTPSGKSWQIDDSALERMTKEKGTHQLVADLVLTHRRCSKIIGTYCKNLWANIYPDGLIHHSLNPAVTSTGRLSSSNPNLQNQDEAVKEAFVSRFHNGYLVEVDWSQLEVIGLAVRTKCRQLIEDLMEGRDIHTELFKAMYAGATPTKEQRKKFKPLTFGLIYGAGANTLAENAGIPKTEAARFIEVFYTRYPEVREWHGQMMANAKRERVPTARATRSGYPAGQYTYKCPLTGRNYLFFEQDGFRPGFPSFSPTELKNYPVQGLSTADWHPFATGTFARLLWSNDNLREKALMVNTVHDSLLFDVEGEALEEFCTFLDKSLKDMVKYWKAHFETEWPVPPKCEIKVGPNWGKMVEWGKA